MSETAEYIAELEDEVYKLINRRQQRETIAFKHGFYAGFEYKCERQKVMFGLSRYKKISIRRK